MREPKGFKMSPQSFSYQFMPDQEWLLKNHGTYITSANDGGTTFHLYYIYDFFAEIMVPNYMTRPVDVKVLLIHGDPRLDKYLPEFIDIID